MNLLKFSPSRVLVRFTRGLWTLNDLINHPTQLPAVVLNEHTFLKARWLSERQESEVRAALRSTGKVSRGTWYRKHTPRALSGLASSCFGMETGNSGLTLIFYFQMQVRSASPLVFREELLLALNSDVAYWKLMNQMKHYIDAEQVLPSFY